MSQPPIINPLQYQRPADKPPFAYRKTLGGFVLGAALPAIAIFVTVIISNLQKTMGSQIYGFLIFVGITVAVAIFGGLGLLATIAVRQKFASLRPQGRTRVVGIILGAIYTIVVTISSGVCSIILLPMGGFRSDETMVIFMMFSSSALALAVPIGSLLSPREKVI